MRRLDARIGPVRARAYTIPTDAPEAERGEIRPDLTRPGLGLIFKQQDAEQYAI